MVLTILELADVLLPIGVDFRAVPVSLVVDPFAFVVDARLASGTDAISPEGLRVARATGKRALGYAAPRNKQAK